MPATRILVLLIASCTLLTPAHADEAAVTELHRIFAQDWERTLRENPLEASRAGDDRYDDRWPDRSLAAYERRHEEDRATLAAVERIEPARLPAAEQLNRELFLRMVRDRIDRYRYGAHLRALNQRGGIQTAHQIAESLPFRTLEDYENWLARLDGLETYVDQTIGLMRAGVRAGNVQPRVIMERVPAQIERQIVADPTASPFYAPLREVPEGISASDRERLEARARRLIADEVVPAYERLQKFFDEEYLPATRDTVGIWDTPRGEEWYRNRAAWFTTTALSPDEIHTLGLAEVERIRAEMLRIVDRVGFDGDLQAFFEFLRTDPRFRYEDPQDLLTAYLAMSKRIDPLLPRFFGRLPRMPYGVRPIPEESAPDTTTAYYMQPALDGSRAGYYYVNLYRPEERPTYEIPVLTIHEAVPGHHLQIALAQELAELPKFRLDFEATAYVEGWALYSESLGEEMGLYEDPYDKFGQLTYEMWRAVRLVVDTGLHEKRWSRQQAIDFFKANAPKTELDIVNEIDRYIAMPGQALAYKIGELKIKELRARAKAALGDSFDIRQFHDVVLGTGAVPLDVLERTVDAWLAEPR
jgi:uncharacterized protein (DUF885 family)